VIVTTLSGKQLMGIPPSFLKRRELAELYAYLVHIHGEQHILCCDVLDELKNQEDRHLRKSFDAGFEAGYKEAFEELNNENS
jgi:hypothetical protein